MDFEYVNINDLTDNEIAVRMRKCNYEKYKSLVRMHLSFELDLNTDEFDLPCHEIVYEDKGKIKKWNRLSKKHKHLSAGCTTGTTKGLNSAGNSPTEGLNQQIDTGFLFHLNEIKNFLLLEKNITQEGIFRKTGSASRQNELRLQIQNDKPLQLADSGYSAHDCATVFKGYLAELTEPLLTDAHYPAHMQIAPLCIGATYNTSATNTLRPPNPERVKRELHLLNSIQLLLLLLPEDNRQLLKDIIEILYAAAQHENLNKMTAENLATLFAPHLICPRNLPPEALHYVSKKMSCIIAYMVAKGNSIFDIPAKLSTDIRAYFLERKRKKTMSPEQTLDESISDVSTVNTIYTFVDREKTAAAHSTNTTDTELAQLYAHIQSLPESSKKRRLIKQFNKQNGQGTPLQFVVMNRIKNSEATRSAKSISDSIKKHIFHKAMYRTPKRSNLTGTSLETPTISSNKNPKLRVLFQSPTTDNNGFTNANTVSCSLSTCSSTLVSSTCTTTNAPLTIKTHALQKSISSSSLIRSNSTVSLLPNATKPNADDIDTILSYNDCANQQHFSTTKPSISVSAPVSRQTSSDLNMQSLTNINALNASYVSAVSAHNIDSLDINCCVTPLKLISEAAKQLINGSDSDAVGTNDKKTVAWNEDQITCVEEISNPCTPIQQSNADLKSRYKSEPNLSRMLKEKISERATVHDMTPLSKTGISFTRKLMKGVSMGNLKFFSTPETTKRLVRSVSSTLKRHSSQETAVNGTNLTINNEYKRMLDVVDDEDLDDDTFEDDPDDHVDSESDASSESDAHERDVAISTSSSSELPGCSTSFLHNQQNNIYRNLDLMTSTPSMFLGRRSMSPITKSTQRMPKAMQESIMTPRSRKPVMVLTTLGTSDQNQTICQTDLSSFREQDEDDSVESNDKEAHILNLHNEDAVSLGGYADIMQRKRLLLNNDSLMQQTSLNTIEHSSNSNGTTEKQNMYEAADIDANALSNNFKEYLLSRSVLTASPVDSSFSSQPDDFASTQEIGELNESQLSSSLLYCLDGNQPEKINDNNEDYNEVADIEEISSTDHAAIANSNERISSISTNPFVILNNARKRAASSDLDKINPASSLKAYASATSKSKSANKENCNNAQGYIVTKKLLISDYPGETSF